MDAYNSAYDRASSPAWSSIYVPLRLVYGLVPLIAGLDKFTNVLVDWERYLPAWFAAMLPFSPTTFMMIVGVIEIIAGLAVLTILPRLGAYVVMAWLIMIAIVVTTGGFLDIAVRDLAMAVGAYTLGQVAGMRGEQWVPGVVGSHAAARHAPAH
jgi:uncharacterized membrane protein YphA (DoxX/SURF4 family)